MVNKDFQRFWFVAVSAILLLLSACSWQPPTQQTTDPTPTLNPEQQVWQMLARRPLSLPVLAAGATCPTTPGRSHGPIGDALGDGPVYVLGGPLGLEATLRYLPPSHFGSEVWGGATSIFALDPAFRGYVLARGAQLDGTNDVGFGDRSVPEASEHVLVSPDNLDGWTRHNTFTRVRAPGCYAYQIDGIHTEDGKVFTQIITFMAIPK